MLLNAYGTGGTTRTVINQANALCAEHDVEIASIFRSRADPPFAIDPRVRLVPLTDFRSDGTRRTGPKGSRTPLTRVTRRFPNPLPHRLDQRFRRWHPQVDLRLVRYLRSEDEGILVTSRPGVNLLAARVAPRRLVRVAQDHMNLGSYRPGLRAAIIRAYPRFDAVVTLTEADRLAYQQALAGTGTRLECIPNGVPRSRLPPASLTSKVLIAAGRLTHQKGFDLLLDAFQQVAVTHPEWQLRIFGAGAERPSLAAQVARLGLTGRAHLHRSTPRLDEQFAAASLFVLSSRYEGLPMVLLEAMTAGLPVVAFDCPTGPAQVIDHGRSGLLVPAQEVPGLAAAICELIEDPARLRAMGAAALQDSQRYSITTVRQRWENLFADLSAARA